MVIEERRKPMLPKITIDLLKNLSTPQSYIKGYHYYQNGVVLKLQIKNNSYIATVSGTYEYNVTISESNGEVKFNCTCPYDFGGICKHCVAVGLEIIKKVKTPSIPEDKEQKKENKAFIDFKRNIYQKASEEIKEEFLLNILKENQIYQKQFAALVLGQKDVETKLSIDKIRDEIKSELENMDFSDIEPDYYDYDHYYTDPWEIQYESAVERIEDVFSGYIEEASDFLKSNNIIDAFKILLGVYEGTAIVEDNINDPDGIIDDFIDEIDAKSHEFINDFVDLFKDCEKSEKALMRMIDLLFERCKYYQKNANKYNEFNYQLNDFREVLLSLIINQTIAKYLDSYLEKLKLKNQSTDMVQLKIAEVLEDKNRWLQVAEKYFSENLEVAQMLLDEYIKQNQKITPVGQITNRVNFVRVAKISFKNWSDKLDKYLYENLKKEDDIEFYIEVLSHFTKRTRSISLFKELKPLLNKPSICVFINSFDKEYRNEIFYIQLLQEQEEFEKILKYVNKHLDSGYFVDIIKPILNVFPTECFDIITRKISSYLKVNIGRSYYQQAVRWMKLLNKIKDKEVKAKVKSYINTLYVIYKQRRALKDEMRKAGIN